MLLRTSRLAIKIRYSCQHSNYGIPPEDADGISLSTSYGKSKYIYNNNLCRMCENKIRYSTKVNWPSQLATKIAKFSCGHHSSLLPLTGSNIKLRWDSKDSDRPEGCYDWPDKCYECALELVLGDEKDKEDSAGYSEKIDRAEKKMAELKLPMQEELLGDRELHNRKADAKSDRDGQVALRDMERKARWGPFQEKWGKVEGQEQFCKKAWSLW